MRTRFAPIWIAIAVSVWMPSAADANIAAPQRYPSVVVHPNPTGRTPLEIDRELLRISCTEVQSTGDPACWFEATYWVRNPTGQPQRVTPGFLSERTDQVEILVDGRRVDRPLTGAEASELVPRGSEQPTDQRYAQPPGQAPVEQAPESQDQRMAIDAMAQAVREGPVQGFELEVAPGAVREVMARGRLTPGEYWKPGHYFAYPPRESRHPLLAPDNRTGIYEVEYLIAPIMTWGGVGPIEVVIQYPRTWDTRVEASASQQRGMAPDGSAEIRFVTRAEQMPSLQIVFELPRRSIHPGGPVAGIGGTFGDAGGFRMRLGWEISEPDWLLYSATADTDFDDVLVLTPMVEAASPWILIIPSLGAGVGVPVRVRPETQVGVRLQATAAFGPAAWVTSFDMFPGVEEGRADRKQVTMLFQLTL